MKVLDHDFPLPELGKAVPYGIYDIATNEGFVNVGISSDTAQFAVNSIRNWWNEMGKQRYPEKKELLITADGGGSNGSRNRLWKYELQKFANENNLKISVSHFPPGTSKWNKIEHRLVIHVSHFPPGTSKWNKIEHRLFCYISKSWEGKPLIDIPTVVNLIGGTTTTEGLVVKCVVDSNEQ